MNIEKIEQSHTKYIGKNIKYYKEITSTHLVAKENIDELENGTVFIAEMQTAGIGTKGRTWHTGKEKNIALTIVTKPECDISKLEGLTVKVAEEIQKAIFKLYKINLKIKEPNDLLLNNKKICGILTESSTIGQNVKYLIISTGFNVNEDFFEDELKEKATSLKKEFGKEFSREDIIIEILERIEKVIEQL